MSEDLVPPCFPPPNPLLLMILSGRVSTSLIQKQKLLRDVASASLNRLYKQPESFKKVTKLAAYLQDAITSLNPAAPPFVPSRRVNSWPDRKELLPDITVSLISRRQDMVQACYTPHCYTLEAETKNNAEDLLPSLTYHPNALLDIANDDQEKPLNHFTKSSNERLKPAIKPNGEEENKLIIQHNSSKPLPYPIYKPTVEPVYRSRSPAYWSLRVRIEEEQELNLKKQNTSLQQLAFNSLNFHQEESFPSSLVLPRDSQDPPQHGAWYSQLYSSDANGTRKRIDIV